MVILEYKFYKKLLAVPVNNFTGKIYNNNYIYNSYDGYNNYCAFLKNSLNHRYYGASFIEYNKKSITHKSWWFNNKYYSSSCTGYNHKKFLKELNKQWLL